MNILRIIKELYAVDRYPKLYIYILSNDKYYITLFLKKFHLEYEYIIKEYSEINQFNLEIQKFDTTKKRLPILLIDTLVLQAQEQNESVLQSVNALVERKPETLYIYLETQSLDLLKDTSQNLHVLKNENAYKRIEQIIFTHSNELFLIKHEKDNKKLFAISIGAILVIVLFLVVYMFFIL